MGKAKQCGKRGRPSRAPMKFEDKEWDIKNIRKEIELIGSSCITWKERKDLENKKVVQLGGKPPKKQRLPLSVARAVMKNQKAREQKILQESLALGRYEGSFGMTTTGKRRSEKRRPIDVGLRPSEGCFRNGVLNVKHLIKPGLYREIESDVGPKGPNGKKKGGKKDRKRSSRKHR